MDRFWACKKVADMDRANMSLEIREIKIPTPTFEKYRVSSVKVPVAILCKPVVRNSARVGDFVIGFLSKRLFGLPGVIKYVAEVTATCPVDEYHTCKTWLLHACLG